MYIEIPVLLGALSCPYVPLFLDRTVDMNGVVYQYKVFIPKSYSNRHVWPVVLFLHGSGERGRDNVRQTQVGLGQVLTEDYPAIVVFPQIPEGETWAGKNVTLALKALDSVLLEFATAPNKIYLTGISLGGTGVWHVASAAPGRFAAIVPICGRAVPEAVDQIGDVPVWLFHGAEDHTVPPENSQYMVDQLGSREGVVSYTLYPGVGHNAWERAYAEPDLPWYKSGTVS